MGGGAGRWQPTHAGLCAWIREHHHTPCILFEDCEPQKWSIQWKVLPSPKNILHWGVFLSTHTWQPAQETDAENLCSENQTAQVLVSFSCLHVYTQHPAPRLMLQSQWTPEATPNLFNVPPTDSSARERIKKRKCDSHISALKNHSRLCETAKKNPHKLQVFSEAEQHKPWGQFLSCLGSNGKVTCLNHHISYCPAWSPDTHSSLVWITPQ